MFVNTPADILYFCLGQPTHFNFCEPRRLDSPAHFDICEGWLDSPTHFDFCEGLDSPTHFDSCDGIYECFIIADLLNRRTTGSPAGAVIRIAADPGNVVLDNHGSDDWKQQARQEGGRKARAEAWHYHWDRCRRCCTAAGIQVVLQFKRSAITKHS